MSHLQLARLEIWGGEYDLDHQSDLKDHFAWVLQFLTHRERVIIELRFGMSQGELYGYSYTLEQVGKILKMTREHVRQVESRAIRKLREMSIGVRDGSG